jgi:hypothetical protein
MYIISPRLKDTLIKNRLLVTLLFCYVSSRINHGWGI